MRKIFRHMLMLMFLGIMLFSCRHKVFTELHPTHLDVVFTPKWLEDAKDKKFNNSVIVDVYKDDNSLFRREQIPASKYADTTKIYVPVGKYKIIAYYDNGKTMVNDENATYDKTTISAQAMNTRRRDNNRRNPLIDDTIIRESSKNYATTKQNIDVKQAIRKELAYNIVTLEPSRRETRVRITYTKPQNIDQSIYSLGQEFVSYFTNVRKDYHIADSTYNTKAAVAFKVKIDKDKNDKRIIQGDFESFADFYKSIKNGEHIFTHVLVSGHIDENGKKVPKNFTYKYDVTAKIKKIFDEAVAKGEDPSKIKDFDLVINIDDETEKLLPKEILEFTSVIINIEDFEDGGTIELQL